MLYVQFHRGERARRSSEIISQFTLETNAAFITDQSKFISINVLLFYSRPYLTFKTQLPTALHGDMPSPLHRQQLMFTAGLERWSTTIKVHRCCCCFCCCCCSTSSSGCGSQLVPDLFSNAAIIQLGLSFMTLMVSYFRVFVMFDQYTPKAFTSVEIQFIRNYQHATCESQNKTK